MHYTARLWSSLLRRNHKKSPSSTKMEPLKWIWVVPGGYVLVSVIFFVFPSLIHKKKRSYFQAFNISHRGGSGEAVENTLEAFQNAVDKGSNMLELDVRLTRDQRVVVMHDNDFSRIAESYQLVEDTNYKDLPSYKYSIPLIFSKVRRVQPRDQQTNRSIPLLSEVLDTFPHMPINIDIKFESGELVKMVSELIKERKREKLTVWGSFRESTTKKCYEENPDISLFFSLRRVVFLTVCFYTGLLPFVPIKEEFFEIPLLKSSSFEAIIPKGMLSKFLITSANFLLINRLFFWHLKTRGVKIFVWVLNEEEEFSSAVALGVDGIMTDFPSKLSSFATTRGACGDSKESLTSAIFASSGGGDDIKKQLRDDGFGDSNKLVAMETFEGVAKVIGGGDDDLKVTERKSTFK